MRDDASRASEQLRRLQRWTGGRRTSGKSSSSWFLETDSNPAQQSSQSDPSPPAADAENEYAEAVAAMNKIVATLDFSALPWVTEVFRRTAGVLADDDPARASVLNNLGTAAQLHHLSTGDTAHLEDALNHYRSAVAAARSSDQDLVLYRCNLALALSDLARKTEDPQLAAEAVETARTAVADTPRADNRSTMALLRLGNALQLHAELAARPELDDEAAEVFREAMQLAPASGDTAGELVTNLGNALLRRYRRHEELVDLDGAVRYLRSAVSRTGEATQRCTLAEALLLQFRRTGDLTDLDAASGELLSALGQLPPGDQLTGRVVWHASAVAVEHADTTGGAEQLHRVLHAVTPAVRAMSTTDPNRTPGLAAYGVLLRRYFQYSGNNRTLDNALAAGEAALAAARPEDEVPAAAVSLVITLLTRYKHLQSSEDLGRAAEVAEKVSAGDHGLLSHLATAQLGLVALHRFDQYARIGELERAVGLLDEAFRALPTTAPERAAVGTDLGRALRTLYRRSGRRRHYRWARQVLTEAARQETAPAQQRFAAASLCGKLAAQDKRWAQAAEAFSTAVDLLPLVVRGKQVVSSPSTQQRWAQVTADAAASALEAGEPERAVELLEHGRTAILAEYLPAGGELGELYRSNPELADESVRLRRLLDRPVTDPVFPGTDDRERLVGAWNELLAEIDEVQQGHLRRKPFSELAQAAEGGSAVLVNLSRYRCDALVVIGERAVTVPLPKADPGIAADKASALLTAVQRNDQQGVADVLDWVWRRIAYPVLNRMGYTTAVQPGSRWPKMWWSCFGPLAYLPVHAACSHEGDSVLDRVLLSYTPTLGCLLRSRNRPLPAGGTPLVAAGAAENVGYQLPRANRVLAQYWPSAEIVSSSHASGSELVRVLPRHPWWHACEPSTQYPARPAAGVVLDRGAEQQSLGLVELGHVPLEQAEFCYLGNCATKPGVPTAAAVSVPAALCFAGYTHVIGTLWAVDEDTSVAALDQVYREVFDGDEPDTDGAARAVHAAARALRDEAPRAPARWAAQVHVGW
ncbi:CHAT domain-containing protein [Saccharopolyspora rectivirgula]|uniref:CHAT domain-containing protein n=1 Tax=Saccharopolyspora rectivirgula TaxID=28042 RepID=UPI002409FB27|nr:CHAT domain-containing protein [Saccharopolyspora rectivirgula]